MKFYCYPGKSVSISKIFIASTPKLAARPIQSETKIFHLCTFQKKSTQKKTICCCFFILVSWMLLLLLPLLLDEDASSESHSAVSFWITYTSDNHSNWQDVRLNSLIVRRQPAMIEWGRVERTIPTAELSYEGFIPK